jgi:nucleoside-diphosphate-sugar epimerase
MSKSFFDESNWGKGEGKDAYAASKIEAEEAVWEIYEQDKDAIEVVCLVPSMVVGAYLSNNKYGSTARFFKLFLSGK